MAKIASKSFTYDERHKQFLEAGKKLVKGDDVSKVSAAAIARACKCTAPLVFAHFKDRDVLRNDVRAYVKSGKITIVKPVMVAKKAPKPAPKKPVVKVAAKKAPAVKKAGSPSVSTSKKAAVKSAAKKPAVVKPKPVPVAVASKLAPPPAPSNVE